MALTLALSTDSLRIDHPCILVNDTARATAILAKLIERGLPYDFKNECYSYGESFKITINASMTLAVLAELTAL